MLEEEAVSGVIVWEDRISVELAKNTKRGRIRSKRQSIISNFELYCYG